MDEMIVNLHMFNLLMKNIIICNLNHTTIFVIDMSGRR